MPRFNMRIKCSGCGKEEGKMIVVRFANFVHAFHIICFTEKDFEFMVEGLRVADSYGK